MATTKSKKTTARSRSSKPKTASAAKTAEARVDNTNTTGGMKGFFARKCDPSENILTIFKRPNIYGAIIGEVVGTMLLTMLLLTLGVYMPLYMVLGIIAITMVVYGLSGAHLNPLVTVGMMASRRVSAIRGVLYILAQVLGAWFALLIVNAFRLSGEGTTEMPAMTAVTGEGFWPITMVEFVGATMLGFCFARATAYKKKVLIFSIMVGGGVALASLFAFMVTSNYLGLQNDFIVNPAIALMYQVLPTEGADFGELFGNIVLTLLTYVIIPMLGGVIGFCVSDIASRLSGDCCCQDACEK